METLAEIQAKRQREILESILYRLEELERMEEQDKAVGEIIEFNRKGSVA